MSDIKQLEERVARLEQLIPQLLVPIPAWQPMKRCPLCGLELDRVMGYCCANTGCPTGLGPVTC